MRMQPYVLYFVTDPYSEAERQRAVTIARTELERYLGGATEVLPAKLAFEAAGGRRAAWDGAEAPDITIWIEATAAAICAAFKEVPPPQETDLDQEIMDAAYIDIVPVSRYRYTEAEWIRTFAIHYGMTDVGAAKANVLVEAKDWYDMLSEACPIAAAENAVREYVIPNSTVMTSATSLYVAHELSSDKPPDCVHHAALARCGGNVCVSSPLP